MRKHGSPATVVDTAALVLSLTGAGLAATGYRITSLWQIAPKVRHVAQGRSWTRYDPPSRRDVADRERALPRIMVDRQTVPAQEALRLLPGAAEGLARGTGLRAFSYWWDTVQRGGVMFEGNERRLRAWRWPPLWQVRAHLAAPPPQLPARADARCVEYHLTTYWGTSGGSSF